MIFYFSATGNTQWAARELARMTGDETIDISRANSACEFSLATDERIGFCFPVHGWRPPRIVREFVRRININNVEGHYCYVVCH